MKVVHLNTYAHFGGAGIAGQRLVAAINELEPGTATLLSGSSIQAEGSFVHRGPWPKLKTKLNFAADVAYFAVQAAGPEYRFAFSPAIFRVRDMSSWKQVIEADIIHIHWINQGFISLSNLKKLVALGKPMVWTLHDMWSFTGGCHYTGSCDNFKRECGGCYLLKQPRSEDLSHRGWESKKAIYAEAKNMTFITCSNWLAEVAMNSSLLHSAKVRAIPNPIDTLLFTPKSKVELRQKWGIHPDVQLILFGAANINDKRKGISFLVESLHELKNMTKAKRIEVAIFGKNKSFDIHSIPFQVHQLSMINSQKDMAEIYAMADVFVLPSVEDNLPNTIMESMACGTPAVAFHVGGLPDLIDHQKNGYLAEYKSSVDLANGIEWLLANPSLSIHARQKVVNKFNNLIVAQQYMDLYQSVLHG